MITKYIEYIKESNDNTGYKTFLIYLSVIDKMNNSFINTDKFTFYKTDHIESNSNLLDLLETKSSLSNLYDIIKNNNNEFSFYIKIDTIFEYGIVDYINSKWFKIGEFNIEEKYIKDITKYKCLENIKINIKNLNIKNLKLLNLVKKDLLNLYSDKKSTISLVNNNIIKKIFNKNEFNYSNFLQLIDKWTEDKKWNKSINHYIDYEDNDVIFYFKVKSIKEEF